MFVDSNLDTSGFLVAFSAESRSFGMTYFKRPTSGLMMEGSLEHSQRRC